MKRIKLLLASLAFVVAITGAFATKANLNARQLVIDAYYPASAGCIFFDEVPCNPVPDIACEYYVPQLDAVVQLEDENCEPLFFD